MGLIEDAIKYNEKAAKVLPEDPLVCHNRIFLGRVKEKLL